MRKDEKCPATKLMITFTSNLWTTLSFLCVILDNLWIYFSTFLRITALIKNIFILCKNITWTRFASFLMSW